MQHHSWGWDINATFNIKMAQHSKGTVFGLHTSEVHFGAPPSSLPQDFVNTKVCFHGVADLPTENGKCVKSPTFFCLGYEWRLRLYPSGRKKDVENYFSIFLCLCSSGSIEVEFGFSIGMLIHKAGVHKFQASSPYGFGFPAFVDRETALNCLVHGSLVIVVKIKPTLASPQFIPDNPLTCKHLQSLWFMDEEYADVVFEVVSDSNSNKLSTTFYAHHNILRKAAPQLADLAMSKEKPARVEISNVSPRTFRDLLSYIYGLEIPRLGQDLMHTKEIIVAADTFGLTSLKLEAEATYISLLTLSLDNVMEHLPFADSMNCAVLKEEVINFIIKNMVDAVEKKVIKDAPGSLGHDILAAFARREKKGVDDKGIANEFCAMRVNELCCKAQTKGLDVDGSREALISALKSYSGEDE